MSEGLWQADVPGLPQPLIVPAWAVHRARDAVTARADPEEATRAGSDAWWLARMRPVSVPVVLDPAPAVTCGWRPRLPLIDGAL